MTREGSSARESAKHILHDTLDALLHQVDHVISHLTPASEYVSTLATGVAFYEMLHGLHQGFECAKQQDWDGFTHAMVEVHSAGMNAGTSGLYGVGMAAFDAGAAAQNLTAGGAAGTLTWEHAEAQGLIAAQNHIVEAAIQFFHPGADALAPEANNQAPVDHSKENPEAAAYFGQAHENLQSQAQPGVSVNEADIKIHEFGHTAPHGGHGSHHSHSPGGAYNHPYANPDSQAADIGAHSAQTAHPSGHATMSLSAGEAAAYAAAHAPAEADSRSSMTISPSEAAGHHGSGSHHHHANHAAHLHAHADSHHMVISAGESQALAIGAHHGAHAGSGHPTLLEQIHQAQEHQHRTLLPHEPDHGASPHPDPGPHQADPGHHP